MVRLSSPPLDWFCLFVCLFVCLFLFLYQNWSPEEKEQSSTCREPKAVCLALEALARCLSSARVIWYLDNQNVESALLNGSRKLELQISFHPMFGTLRIWSGRSARLSYPGARWQKEDDSSVFKGQLFILAVPANRANRKWKEFAVTTFNGSVFPF